MSTATTMNETALPEATPTDRRGALWRRAQAVSGLLLATFFAIHLVNVPLGALPGAYDAYQRVMRQLYQSPFFEIPFIVLPIVVHLAAGVRAIVRSGSRAPATTWPQRLHRWAAWALLVFVGGHFAATRGASFFEGVYPESSGLRFALAWVPAFFWPYYVLLGVAGVVHVGWGIPRALSVVRRHADRSASSRPLAIGIAVMAIGILLGVLGIGGVLYPITSDPFDNDYADIYRGFDDSPLVPDVPDPASD